MIKTQWFENRAALQWKVSEEPTLARREAEENKEEKKLHCPNQRHWSSVAEKEKKYAVTVPKEAASSKPVCGLFWLALICVWVTDLYTENEPQ